MASYTSILIYNTVRRIDITPAFTELFPGYSSMKKTVILGVIDEVFTERFPGYFSMKKR